MDYTFLKIKEKNSNKSGSWYLLVQLKNIL